MLHTTWMKCKHNTTLGAMILLQFLVNGTRIFLQEKSIAPKCERSSIVNISLQFVTHFLLFDQK